MKTIMRIVLIGLLLVTVGLMGAAVASGGSTATIGLNIIWAYFLVVFAVAASIFSAVFSMIKAPAGLKSSLISLGLVVVVVGLSYQLASSNPQQIMDISTGGFFDAESTLITEMSIIVTYIAFAGALLVSLAGELLGVYRSLVKTTKGDEENGAE